MRSGGVLAAIALVLALAGCAGTVGATNSDIPATVSPSATASPAASGTALDLVGSRWKVDGKAGTSVAFVGGVITVASGGASSSYAWSAQGDQVLIGGSSSSLHGPVAAPWLTSTTRVERTAAGWSLLDASGATTARLTGDGVDDLDTVTSLLGTATPGPGVVDAPASAIAGRWVLPSDLRTTLTFTDGAWRATASCTSGTVGGIGVYRVLDGGRLLVTRTMTPIRGCPIIDGPRTAGPNAITAIARAASFEVAGDTLTLFDRSGTSLGSLTRG